MDWSKTHYKPFSNHACSKKPSYTANRGFFKMVDDDVRKVEERPWVAPHRSDAQKYQSETVRSLGPKYPVKQILQKDASAFAQAEAVVLDAWNTRWTKGKGMHACGADREKLTSWHDKLMLPNDKLPPLKPPHPTNWRTQYTKDFSAEERAIGATRRTRLAPEQGTMDKITHKQNYNYSEKLKPFMGARMDEQWKPDKYNPFGVMKMRSQVVFG